MSWNDDDGSASSTIKTILKRLKALIGLTALVIALATGRTKLDIPNYPVNVDDPVISDGDDSIVIKDFSLVTTIDGKSHFCYEMSINGVTKYFDVSAKKIIDSDCIKSIEEYEDEVKKEVPTINGYGYKRDVDKEIDNTCEEYGVKTKLLVSPNPSNN